MTIGGYNVQDTLSPPRPGTAVEERAYWYQWYFNTERGRLGLEQNRYDICRLLWQEWSPTWAFGDATYERTAPSFDNPNFVDLVIHSYRHRHRNAPSDPRFTEVERLLASRPPITVPSIVLHGADDTVGPPYRSEGGDDAISAGHRSARRPQGRPLHAARAAWRCGRGITGAF